jgi:transposase
MANRRSKIETLGLSEDVQALVASGLSARRIATRLSNEHPEAEISESTVTRYVARVRKEASGEAFQKIKDHVDRVVPDDLNALEEMESQSLEWAREAGQDRVERMADAAFEIRGEIDAWIGLLVSSDKDEQEATARRIIRRCLSIMAREDRLQQQRTQAMLTAIKIIDLKLRQAGLLDEEGKGRIILVERKDGDTALQCLKKDDEYQSFRVPGGEA